MQPQAPATTLPGWISRWFATFRTTQETTALPVRKDLQPRSLFKATLTPEGKITCTRGRLWVTASSLPGDIVLRAGDTLSVPRTSQVVIEALELSAVDVRDVGRGKKHPRPFIIPT